MARAVLALGANIGDAASQIEAAIKAIGENPQITLLKRSTIIVTPPWGVVDQDEFHNGAVLVETDLSPLELLDFCLATETVLGRVRTLKWGPRIIDIDVIAYDRLEMETERLTLPHPYAHERDFVLVPVREIAPDVAEWLVRRSR
ncbi:2-amino-4-hydroxy-6-hydroxymethyldihydropteridine diphosphokinase [Pelagibacterium sediminicola]|uniref:2-amino-4-hydroxy-6- hydroxymethyldihydropteridine diphosphokinase n=1 Tax=Pelagibacterium sediminicola TaxID=2248761 RepID=UPI000E30E63D|nr:2-amino-4-hydroxy-6-hydroxymethyldihydropteridine diphosphokinase [Pelagibacterium sediminicola]